MTLAYILINVKTGYENELIKELKKIDGIKEAHRIYGIYDTIIKIESDSNEKLKYVLTSKIRRLPQVKSTLTMIIVDK